MSKDYVDKIYDILEEFDARLVTMLKDGKDTIKISTVRSMLREEFEDNKMAKPLGLKY